jgi:hypothetical protein
MSSRGVGMNQNKKVFVVLSLLLSSVSAGCSTTTMSLRTEPASALVKFYSHAALIHEQQSNIIDFKFEKQFLDEVFKDEQQTAELGLVIEKQGYRPLFRVLTVRKGQDTRPELINLEKLNTEISFDIDPPGAKAILYASIEDARRDKGMRDPGKVKMIPLGEVFGGSRKESEFMRFPELKAKYSSQIQFAEDFMLTLPWSAAYTDETANMKIVTVRAVRLEAEDYVPQVKEISIRAGQSNVFVYKLEKMITTLKVLSELEGVEIEDTTKDENYGYLGKAPLVRQFSYQEAMRDRNREDNKVHLTLRASKTGFADQKIDVAVPWGEEQTVKVTLKPRSSQISFQSDPEGVHVYVRRTKIDTRYDKTTGEWRESEVPVLKHLGTTPFTYYMDPEDPLEHNDELVFKKTGYKDNNDNYAIGVNTYHTVMVPEVIMER